MPAGGQGHSSALQAAADGRHLAVIRLLVTAGADVNMAPAGRREKITTLKAAARNGHLDVLKYLIAHGASVDVQDDSMGREGYYNEIHSTPLESAVAGGHSAAARVLIDAGAQVTPISAPKKKSARHGLWQWKLGARVHPARRRGGCQCRLDPR